MTLFGTRPEIIRLSAVIERLDRSCDQVLVHTGQNFDRRLSDIFFDELELRPPDIHLAVEASDFAEQIGMLLARVGEALTKVQPDRLLILGDTNSSLSVLVAKRRAIPIYHMEAGNRCYDDRVPEEINRRVIDHASDVLMPYTENSRRNLLREGLPGNRIYVTGNPIHEVLQKHEKRIGLSSVLSDLGLVTKRFFLVTMHRQENVDDETRLFGLREALTRIETQFELPVIVSTHPRTASRLKALGEEDVPANTVRYLPPFGFADFITLERNALCVLTDSGTVQEECCIHGVRNVTIRDVTERPETIECGSNTLAGADPNMILDAVRNVLDGDPNWRPPEEYLADNVSDIVAKITLGHLPH